MNTASTRARTLTFVWMLLHGLLTIPLLDAQDTDRDGLSDAYERGVGRYQVIAGSFTWHQARIDAESRGGHLATIVSSFEWADMKRVLGTAMLGKNLWLGATDELAEGNWRWVTGEPWNFTNWRVNEPGNDSLGNGQGVPEHYLMIWGNETASRDGDQAFWNDATVTGGVLARDGYILERGYWTDMNDPDTDDDGLADSEEVFALPALERITASLTWNEARADAEARGGHLAVITTTPEWERLLQVLGTNSPNEGLWLGASDLTQEGLWRWITGEPFAITRWAAGQPDNAGDQDYLLMLGKFWIDSQSSIKASYVLEREGVQPTDPNNPDSDGDGLRDGDEVRFYRTDPRNLDTDRDSLSDFDELRNWRSNPLVADSDSDGLSDGDEVFTHRTDPTKSDSDGDGFSDKLEITYHSDPLASSSIPSPPTQIFTAVEILFNSQLGATYQIQIINDQNAWTAFGPRITGTGAQVSRLISTRGSSQAFWRVVLVP
ncbi:MAG: hypothetical protein JNN07_27865 [Verrucomicrobiales bacterium]|nr:hypothetical protein [Verrucomicrobiales bacterium]